MGQGLSCIGEPQPEYHSRYDDHAIKLANCRAATKDASTNSYIFVRYTAGIENIVAESHALSAKFLALHRTHSEGKPLMDNVMQIRFTIDSIRRGYENFFRDSAYKVDRLVPERKNLAKTGYFDLEWMKDDVVATAEDSNPNFEVVEWRIGKQIKAAEDLYDHFRRSHPSYISNMPEADLTDIRL